MHAVGPHELNPGLGGSTPKKPKISAMLFGGIQFMSLCHLILQTMDIIVGKGWQKTMTLLAS